MTPTELQLTNFPVIIGAMLLLYFISISIRNASVVDVFWDQAFAEVALSRCQCRPLGIAALIGTLLRVTAFPFEAVGDWQLRKFRADPADRGTLRGRGLRRCSRHPDYFSNACLWQGLWLIACNAPGLWWTAIGPTLMTFLLLEISGISLLEKSLAESSRQIAGQACWPQLRDAGNVLAVLHIGQQAAQFLPDYRVALAHTGLKSVPLKH